MADEATPGFFQKWGKVHRERKAKRKQFFDEYHERSADLSRIRTNRDYDHLDAFYEGNPERGAQLVPAGSIDDAGVHWTISWLPLTQEVIAQADRWVDSDVQEPVPDDVSILGKAGSQEATHAAILRSTSLESLRDALY